MKEAQLVEVLDPTGNYGHGFELVMDLSDGGSIVVSHFDDADLVHSGITVSLEAPLDWKERERGNWVAEMARSQFPPFVDLEVSSEQARQLAQGLLALADKRDAAIAALPANVTGIRRRNVD